MIATIIASLKLMLSGLNSLSTDSKIIAIPVSPNSIELANPDRVENFPVPNANLSEVSNFLINT